MNLKNKKMLTNFLRLGIKDKDDKHLDLIKHLAEGVNSKDKYTSNKYRELSSNFRNKRIISRAEHGVILRPLFGFSKSEIERAIKHINQEMEEQPEEFYKHNTTGYENKNDDYSL